MVFFVIDLMNDGHLAIGVIVDNIQLLACKPWCTHTGCFQHCLFLGLQLLMLIRKHLKPKIGIFTLKQFHQEIRRALFEM